MPLLDLKTDLKSLKYGNDQPGGGSSGQPYVTTDINTVDTGFNRFRMTKFDDGLVRGGVVGAANASIVDTIRVGKFLKDFPKGPLFIVKQIGLQLSNPRLEIKKLKTDNPTSGGGLLRNVGNFILNTANKIQNAVGPTRIYNLGINTLAQVPINAFGQHIVRHGFTPKRNDDNLYFKVAQYNNNEDSNRLTQLRSILGNTNDIANYISGPSSVYGIGKTIIRRRGDFLIVNQDITENEWAIKGAKEAGISYRLIGHEGGTRDGYIDASRRITDFTGVSNQTGSILASNSLFFKDKKSIQSVFNSRRYNTPLGLNEYDKLSQYSGSNTWFPQNGEPRRASLRTDLGVSKQYFSGSNIGLPNLDITTYSQIVTTNLPIQVNGNKVTSLPVGNKGKISIKNASYQKYKDIIDSKKLRETTYTLDENQINAFGIYGNRFPIKETLGNILPDSTQLPVYTNKDKVVKINIPWNKVTREERVGSGLQDQINLTPIFNATAGTHIDTVNISGIGEKNINDLVKFRIQALNGDNPTQANWIIFRAYLTQFSDNTDATWNPVKYVGRGEDFYIYNGFSRKIQIGFKVAALSVEEMEPMYQKLNYLMGNLMPDYKDNLLMRGPLVKMTVGNWLDGQDGILTSLNYTVPNDSPWEVSLNTLNGNELLELPHIIEVSLGFTPIGSQTKGVNKISQKSQTTSHIAQNYNDYQYIKTRARSQVIVPSPDRISEEQFNNPSF